MRKMVKTGAAALMLTCMASNVWAAAGAASCARPEDLNALRTAAIQQRLMVAALSCDSAALYNAFVTSFQKELQASDRALQAYFRRTAGATGTERYHAYKTHMANASSMQSISNITTYCDSAKAAFAASVEYVKTGLVSFLSGQTIVLEDAYQPCAVQTAGVASPAAVPQSVPLPRMKPGAEVVTAQGTPLSAN